MREFILWGWYTHTQCWLKIVGGSVGQCRASMRGRKAEPSWLGLIILPKGEKP